MPDKTPSVEQALRDLLAVVPPYAGLAVALRGEEPEFNEAEDKVANAVRSARRALALTEDDREDDPGALDRYRGALTPGAVVLDDENRWVRAFNRLEAAVTHHKRATANVLGDHEDADTALYKASAKILADLTAREES